MKATILDAFGQKLICVLALALLTTACGLGGSGGGGGRDNEAEEVSEVESDLSGSRGNPAKVRLNVDPKTIDAGDIMTVEIELREISRPFILKIKHHVNLVYIDDSMLIYTDDSSTAYNTTPRDYEVTEDVNYLVETTTDISIFGKKRSGRIVLNFQGVAKAEFDLAVDVDEYNLSAPSNTFDPANPQFSALVHTGIEIDDENLEQDDADEQVDESEEQAVDDTTSSDDATSGEDPAAEEGNDAA